MHFSILTRMKNAYRAFKEDPVKEEISETRKQDVQSFSSMEDLFEDTIQTPSNIPTDRSISAASDFSFDEYTLESNKEYSSIRQKMEFISRDPEPKRELILTIMRDAKKPITISDIIVKGSKYSHVTIRRYVKILYDEGKLERDPQTLKYSLVDTPSDSNKNRYF